MGSGDTRHTPPRTECATTVDAGEEPVLVVPQREVVERAAAVLLHHEPGALPLVAMVLPG